MPPEPPTRLGLEPREWSLVLPLSLAGMGWTYSEPFLKLALPQVQATLGIADSELGGLLGVARLGGLAAIPLVVAADRVGRRRLFLFAVAGAAVTGGLAGFAQTGGQLAFLRFVFWGLNAGPRSSARCCSRSS